MSFDHDIIEIRGKRYRGLFSNNFTNREPVKLILAKIIHWRYPKDVFT